MCGVVQCGFPTDLTWKTAPVEWALGLDFMERVRIHRIHGCKIGVGTSEGVEMGRSK
jgi:hypothetical protein